MDVAPTIATTCGPNEGLMGISVLGQYVPMDVAPTIATTCGPDEGLVGISVLGQYVPMDAAPTIATTGGPLQNIGFGASLAPGGYCANRRWGSQWCGAGSCWGSSM